MDLELYKFEGPRVVIIAWNPRNENWGEGPKEGDEVGCFDNE